jgi:hypothetical protein
MAQSPQSQPAFIGDDRDMIANLLARAAQAVKSGLIKDGIDLGLVAAHLRAFLAEDEQEDFDSAIEGNWNDRTISESLQRGPYQVRWDFICKLEPHLSRLDPNAQDDTENDTEDEDFDASSQSSEVA